MLRELSRLLADVAAAVEDPVAQSGLALVGLAVREVEVHLPIDLVPVFKDGGCALLADVARSAADTDWYTQRSTLSVVLRAGSTEEPS